MKQKNKAAQELGRKSALKRHKKKTKKEISEMYSDLAKKRYQA